MNVRRLLALALFASAPLLGHAFTPENGWYIPITSDNTASKGGTGIAIEIQNEYLFAAGFIYGVNGLPIWVTMQGQMTHNSDGSWERSDTLYTAQNGQCLGSLTTCPYKPQSPAINAGHFTIKLLADNIGQISWGNPTTGDVNNVLLKRFDYQLGGGPGSLVGRWDIVIDHQGAANGDRIQFEGDRLRLNQVQTNADNTIVFNGCVDSDAACTAGQFAANGTGSTPGFFGGRQYQVVVYSGSIFGSAPYIMRVYSFGENGLSGAFANTIRGTVNLCDPNGADTVATCTAAAKPKYVFVAHRSASGRYAQTNAGMNDKNP